MRTQVFETNITKNEDVKYAENILQLICADGLIAFNLIEEFHVLTIQVDREISEIVIEVLASNGYHCQELEN